MRYSVLVHFIVIHSIICIQNAYAGDITTTTITTTTRFVNPLEDCIAETKVNRAFVNKLKSGNFRLNDKNLKRWAFCYLEKNGVMSSEGVLRQGVVLRKIPDKDKAKIETLINKCLYKKRHHPVDTAWNYLSCFHAREPKYAKIVNKL